MRTRIQDFFDMGVPVVWIIDSAVRTVFACTPATMTEQTAGILRVEGTAIEVAVADTFSTLDA